MRKDGTAPRAGGEVYPSRSMPGVVSVEGDREVDVGPHGGPPSIGHRGSAADYAVSSVPRGGWYGTPRGDESREAASGRAARVDPLRRTHYPRAPTHLDM